MAQTTTERVAGAVRATLARQRRTRTWLARAVEMPPSTLGRRLNGVHPFDVEELDLVATALEVSLVDIIREAAA